MRIALVQTQQNKLYDFLNPEQRLCFDEAKVLQKDMINQSILLMEEAIEKGCDLLVTTEAINFAGQPHTFKTLKDQTNIDEVYQQYADLIPTEEDSIILKLSNLAKKGHCYMVVGMYLKRKVENRYCMTNSAIIFSPEGKVLDIYDKIHLAGSENDYLEVGKRYVSIDSEFGKIGVLICFDAQFPETYRELALQGCNLIVCSTWGWEQIYGHARAYENGIYVAAAMAVPYWGPIEGLRSPSEIIAPDGTVVVRGSNKEAGIVIADVDIHDCMEERKQRLCLRRPGTYQSLNKEYIS